MSKLHLILDLATSRVIYFTSDLSVPLKTDGYTAIAVYEGELPNNMTLDNCFNYRYVNKELVNTQTNSRPTSLIEQNRMTIINFIQEKVREKFLKISENGFNNEYYRCLVDEILENCEYILEYQQLYNIDTIENALKKVKSDFVAYRKKILLIGYYKTIWIQKARSTNSNDELFAIRDEVFAKLSEI